MALVLKDRVKETTSTTGTGAISLGGAVANFQAFSAVLSDADTTYYAIIDVTNSDYEIGLGTYSSGGNTLARTTILESSNGGSAVNFGAGSKNVFIAYPAEKSVYLDGSNQLVINSTAVTATAAELNLLDGSSAGTVVNSKAVIYGASGEVNATDLKVGTAIQDTNGAELIKVSATGSAVNEVTVANAATGNNPTLSATGDDTNVGIDVTPKGTGEFNVTASFMSGVFSDRVNAIGNTGAATTINCDDANVFTATLNDNCTFTIASANGVSNRASSFTLVLTNDGTAGRTVAFSGATFKYPGGSVPTRTTTANATDIWFFFTPDGGTTFFVVLPAKNLYN